MTNEEIVTEAKQLLEKEENRQIWKKAYKQYAEGIIKNSSAYKDNAKLFQVNKPLVAYTSISKVTSNGKTTNYDLRFAGQSVGEIRVNKEDDKVYLHVSKDQAKRAMKFGFKESKELEKAKWHSKDAINFRSFYSTKKSTDKIKVHSKEHRIESFLLKEFSKNSSENKKLCYIQPVKLGGNFFFQQATPLQASDHKPSFSGATGGGIDILARVTHRDGKSRIAIIELKDENKRSESQMDVMTQALIYATFIAYLLRSESGRDWYNIFRENFKEEKDVPKEIELDVVTLMPEGTSEEGDLADIPIPEVNATLHLYTLYYTKDANGNPDSFSGTLIKDMKE